MSEPATGRRRLFAVLAFLLPFAGVLLLEGGLRVAGFGQSYPLFVPVLGSDDFLRVHPDVVRRFMTNEAMAPDLWIRPVHFARQKTPETLRIVVQGGSTAAGYPYGYGASPAGMLRQRLQRTFPEKNVEVITTAMSAVNSYTLLDFADEIIAVEPDAVVVYSGHNEYLGLLGVGSAYSVGRQRFAVQLFLAARDWRVFQLSQALWAPFRPAVDKNPSLRRTLMATIASETKIEHGSPLDELGGKQYAANLQALLNKYKRAGIPVFVGTLVANDHQPPFAGERAAEFFAAAKKHEERGHVEEALRFYLAASDHDEIRFRAPHRFNDLIRAAANKNGSVLVDINGTFRRVSDDGTIGYNLMLEHLHPNLEGYFLMADAFYEALCENPPLGPCVHRVDRETAWREIPVTEVDRIYGEYRILALTADWPFTDQPEKFRLPPATSRVEEIAQSYFHGRYDWADAMHSLLDHYRRTDDEKATLVALLLAVAFPNDASVQALTAEPEPGGIMRSVPSRPALSSGLRASP